MLRRCGLVRGSWLFSLVLVGMVAAAAVAAPPKKLKPGEYNPAHRSVELFQAVDTGDLEVKVIPKDSTQCRVFIRNKTDEPLNVQLPEAFAAVPVLAQFGGGGAIGGGGGGRIGGGGGGGSSSQSMGGGMGGMGGMGGGMFNVAPEKVADFRVTTVCLEHGKGEPKPKIPYRLAPIDEFTDNVHVQELCQLLGTGQLDQRAAQVAAWHLSDKMSWDELAAKVLKFANGTTRPYFSPREIQSGVQIVATVAHMARQRGEQEDTKTPGKSDSLSEQ